MYELLSKTPLIVARVTSLIHPNIKSYNVSKILTTKINMCYLFLVTY